MSETTTSHPVKPGIATELHYTHSDSMVTIHKAGCKHAAESKRPFDPTTIQPDEWFRVAPCARGRA